VVELRPALKTKELHEAFAGLVADGAPPRAARQEPAPARGHLLALPAREPGDLATDLGAESLPARAVGLAKIAGVRPYYERWDSREHPDH